MDYGEQNLRRTILKDLSPPDIGTETVKDAINRILELYPDIPALGSPFNTGNETFGLPQAYKRWAAICKCFLFFIPPGFLDSAHVLRQCRR